MLSRKANEHSLEAASLQRAKHKTEARSFGTHALYRRHCNSMVAFEWCLTGAVMHSGLKSTAVKLLQTGDTLDTRIHVNSRE